MLNNVAALSVVLYLGGEATYGKIENERYFLCGNYYLGQEHFTEVTKAVFNYSLWHSRLTITLVFFLFVLIFVRDKIAQRLRLENAPLWDGQINLKTVPKAIPFRDG
jgi:hypothetical protein